MGFRPREVLYYVDPTLRDGFHLFQRVVGFRLEEKRFVTKKDSVMFPSLSESSGFPTKIQIREGLRRVNKFPSLSESSGFPTH